MGVSILVGFSIVFAADDYITSYICTSVLTINQETTLLTCVWELRQFFGAYLLSLLSGSTNRYSPSETSKSDESSSVLLDEKESLTGTTREEDFARE